MLFIVTALALCYNTLKVVMILGWKDNFKDSFDVTYQLVKDKVSNIKFPCYGGKFYWFLVSRHFDNYYFYLTTNSLIYTLSSAYILEIPFKDITKMKIKRGLLLKNHYHIWLRADQKYHFLICDIKDLNTKLTGVSSENVRNFINTLKIKVNIE